MDDTGPRRRPVDCNALAATEQTRALMALRLAELAGPASGGAWHIVERDGSPELIVSAAGAETFAEMADRLLSRELSSAGFQIEPEADPEAEAEP